MSSFSVTGKVLDGSALLAMVAGWQSALTWLDVAELSMMELYVPSLAWAEVLAVRPDAGQQLADLRLHPAIVDGELDAVSAYAVRTLLEHRDVFDVLAGHVVHIAHSRLWPALSSDPGRLLRIDPDLEVQHI